MGRISKTSVVVFKRLTKEDLISILELCSSIPKRTSCKITGIHPVDFYEKLVNNGYIASGSFSKSGCSESIYFFYGIDEVRLSLHHSIGCTANRRFELNDNGAKRFLDFVYENQNILDNLSEKTKELLNSGKVVRWKKNPAFFFVKGFKYAGLMLNHSGNLSLCQHYYRIYKDDLLAIEKYLEINLQ